MYVTSYKLNNSYTTYIIHNYNEGNSQSYPVKTLEWKCGAQVRHSFHGQGTIQSITNHKITVYFKQSKTFKKLKSIQVTFEFQKLPGEIDSLRLCY